MALKVSATSRREGQDEVTRVTVENPGPALAFFVHLKINRGAGGEEILPVIWEDNYFALMPGEKRDLSATYAARSLQGNSAVVALDGWNATENATPVMR